MHNIQISGKSYFIPAKRTGLNQKQQLDLAKLYFTRQSKEAEELMLLHILSGIPLKLVCRIPADRFIIEISPLLKDLGKPVPSCIPKFRNYYGPRASLDNVSVEEYITADIYFKRFAKSGEDADLCRFVACFYRTSTYMSRKNADRRKPLDTYEPVLDKEAGKIAKLPKEFKYHVLTYFIACVDEFPKLYGNLYKGDKKSRKKKKSSWADTVLLLAQTPEKIQMVTKELMIHDALSYLDKEDEKIENLKQANQ
jgi:hypothetical protein